MIHRAAMVPAVALAWAAALGVVGLIAQASNNPSAQTSAAAPADGPTYARDVAPLLFSRCGNCHHPGGPAPFSVYSYDSVRPFATQIADTTRRGYMPPWRAEPTAEGEFLDQRHLTPAEIEMLGR